MALGTVATRPGCKLQIIPVGMNYFHAHKFRSRAVIEFGTPIDVPPELVTMFDGPKRRDAISEMLEIIRQGLISVTVTTPDYDTLMVCSACLHTPLNQRSRVYSRSSKPFVVSTIRKAQNYLFLGLSSSIADLSKAMNVTRMNLRSYNSRNRS